MESLKFYITNDEPEKGFEILKLLLGEDVNEEDKETIKKQTKELNKESRSTFSNYSDLFNSENWKLSLNLFTLWYISSYVYYGLIYILPTVLEEYHKEGNHHLHHPVSKKQMLTAAQYDLIIADIIMSCGFEIPSDLSNGFTPNIEWLGRKGAIIWGFFFSAVFSLTCIIHPDFMPIYASLVKFFINISFNILYTYTSEAYPTKMRSTAIGVCNFFSRFGGFTTPFFCDEFFKIQSYFPTLGFLFTSGLGFVLSILLPFDTLGRVTK